VGVDDASYLEQQFDPVFKKQDLINNPVGQAYMRLLVEGQPTVPFSMATDWPDMQAARRDPQVAKSLAELSRMRFGRDRALVEVEITERAGLNEPSAGSAQPKQPFTNLPVQPPPSVTQNVVPAQPQNQSSPQTGG
jgi:hypothetical protein